MQFLSQLVLLQLLLSDCRLVCCPGGHSLTAYASVCVCMCVCVCLCAFLLAFRIATLPSNYGVTEAIWCAYSKMQIFTVSRAHSHLNCNDIMTSCLHFNAAVALSLKAFCKGVITITSETILAKEVRRHSSSNPASSSLWKTSLPLSLSVPGALGSRPPFASGRERSAGFGLAHIRWEIRSVRFPHF